MVKIRCTQSHRPLRFEILESRNLLAAVSLDFEILPDGTVPGPLVNPLPIVGASYTSVGVTFGSINEQDPTSPTFAPASTYGGTGIIVIDGLRATNPNQPFNIKASFSPPVVFISAKVSTAAARSVVATARNANGNIVASVTSAPLNSSFDQTTLSISNAGQISSVEWLSSDPFIAFVRIDDLTFETANSAHPQSRLYTDKSLTVEGLVGSYVNKSLRTYATQDDWRASQTISGTRTDQVSFTDPNNGSWGSRTSVGLTGGTDANWDTFSAQWDGFVQVLADNVTLRTWSDDGSRLWVDANDNGEFENTPTEFADNGWGTGHAFRDGQPLAPLANGVYRIRMQYEETTGGNVMQLKEAPDTDGDGLLDEWELYGIDYDRDGNIDLDLEGADPLHKDLYVEIDYMIDPENGKSYRPIPAGLDEVKKAFAAAPVNNPDNTTGITLHLMVDDEVVPFAENLVFTWDTFTNRPIGTLDDFDDIKLGSNSPGNLGSPYGIRLQDGHFGTVDQRIGDNAVNVIGAKRLAFRYCVFGDSHSLNPKLSGIGELGGNDFMVTLGNWSDLGIIWNGGAGLNLAKARRNVEAGTFMHELGHTLGIHHGGATTDGNNNKPNYLSIMNYTYQLPNIDPNRPLDYSRQVLATLDEDNLNEFEGLSGPSGRPVFFFAGSKQPKGPNQSAKFGPNINWDGSRSLSADTEGDINGSNTREVLTGYNDWPNLIYSFRATNTFADGVRPLNPDFDSYTEQKAVSDAMAVDYDGDGFVNALDNAPGVFNPAQSDSDGDGVGDAQVAGDFDLAIARAIGANVSATDELLTYSITVMNRGDVASAGVTVTDTLPDGVPFVSASTEQGTFTVTGNSITFDIGVMESGKLLTVIVVVRPPATGNLTNTAVVVGTQTDPNTTNNAATNSTMVLLAHPWLNRRNSLDVNDDRQVAPLDALLVINYLNAGFPTDVPLTAAIGGGPGYLDTTGNDEVAPLDALIVINALNAGLAWEGEAQGTGDGGHETGGRRQGAGGRGSSEDVDWMALMALDVMEETGRRRRGR